MWWRRNDGNVKHGTLYYWSDNIVWNFKFDNRFLNSYQRLHQCTQLFGYDRKFEKSCTNIGLLFGQCSTAQSFQRSYQTHFIVHVGWETTTTTKMNTIRTRWCGSLRTFAVTYNFPNCKWLSQLSSVSSNLRDRIPAPVNRDRTEFHFGINVTLHYSFNFIILLFIHSIHFHFSIA